MDTQTQNPFKLCIPLVQMTPIYHFQADEAEATLRATEVKPKLDRYLIQAAFGDDPTEFKRFCIGEAAHSQNGGSAEKQYALNYRLNITVDDPSKLSTEKLYIEKETKLEGIGSIWDLEKRPAGTMLEEKATVTLHFFSRHRELLNAIDEWIDAFFAGENFGCRQSKGFGSFATERSTKEHSLFEEALKKHMLTTKWATYKGLRLPFAMHSGAVSWIDALNDIRDIHKVLKSGINRPGKDEAHSIKIPSYLIGDYAANDPKLSKFYDEKKTIYNNTLDGLMSKTPQEVSPDRWRFFRAMLGLPQFYEFRHVNINNQNYLARIAIAHSEKNKEENKSVVERFRSPITYKPVKIGNSWRYYMIPIPIPKDMFSHSFDMKLTPVIGKGKKLDVLNTGITAPEPFDIQTPSAEEFDLLDFLLSFSAGEPAEQSKQQNQPKRLIGYALNQGSKRTAIYFTFGHLTITKEEKPDE